jgi:hypothetical protein
VQRLVYLRNMSKIEFDTKLPAFETLELRKALKDFYETSLDETDEDSIRVGAVRWAVYAFYDYDGEPIYVGQTREAVSARIGRHLTGQRSDAVAKSVLDPFEVCEISVWPLPEFQDVNSKSGAALLAPARAQLNALEYAIHQMLIGESKFGEILNEKDPPSLEFEGALPTPLRAKVITDEVMKLRSHPDFRIARRAAVISRLSQGIAERKIDMGLRRVLAVQAKRLEWLANERFNALGGAGEVEIGPTDEG